MFSPQPWACRKWQAIPCTASGTPTLWLVGRIRYASERTPGIWIWHVQVRIPGSPFGSASSLDEAKAHFKAAWLAQGDARAGQAWAAAYREMNLRNEP